MEKKKINTVSRAIIENIYEKVTNMVGTFLTEHSYVFQTSATKMRSKKGSLYGGYLF